MAKSKVHNEQSAYKDTHFLDLLSLIYTQYFSILQNKNLAWYATNLTKTVYAESGKLISQNQIISYIDVRGGGSGAAAPHVLKNFRASASCSKILNDKKYIQNS